MKLLLLSFALFLPVSGATITLVPSTLNPAVGETFTADVQVTRVFDGLSDEELILFGFDVGVENSEAFVYLGAAAGSLFLDAGLAGADVSGFPIAFSLRPGDFTEPLVLATLTFQRLTSGASELAVFGDPDTNPDHGLFYLGNVLPIEALLVVSPVPEPSTFAMAAAATLALCVLRQSLLSR